MIKIQPPKLIYTPDDAEYVETYMLDEEGNPTEELANHIVEEEGFYAISDKQISNLTKYAGEGIYTQLAGVKTYCYVWSSLEAYELDFPPVVEEITEPTQQPETPAYDLDAGKAQAHSVLRNHYNTRQAALASKYPERESLTWSTQLEESLRYLDGKGSVFIERVAEQTGQTAKQYAELIIANNTLYQQALADLTAMRMLTDRAIDSAQTQQDISDIIGGLL